MEYQHLTTELSERILTITINRESKMNALNISLLGEMRHLFNDINKNDEVAGVIITGAGSKAFAAGADIAEFANYTKDEGSTMAENGHNTLNKIEHCKKPVIAAVNGFALGGGCELAMACHFRIAIKNAKFGQPEVNLGIIPGYGGTQRLVQLIGKGKAMELMMTGDMINAEEAYRLGLVNHVTEPENLLPFTREVMEKILTKAPVAISHVIEAVNGYFDYRENGFENEIELFADCMETEDFKEGTTAFLEKRKADFKGR